jgi:predicted RNA binding protein YcfA (HicA-like mRNA interferase family)
MPKLPIIKTKELIRVLEKLGFFKFHQVGSHAQFKHKDGKRVTVPIHHGRDIDKKMLRGVINDLDITVEEFTKLL